MGFTYSPSGCLNGNLRYARIVLSITFSRLYSVLKNLWGGGKKDENFIFLHFLLIFSFQILVSHKILYNVE